MGHADSPFFLNVNRQRRAENPIWYAAKPMGRNILGAILRDTIALNSLSMARTSATNKLTNGIHVALRKKLVSDLKKYCFSKNLDECTHTSNEKALSIIVCYFSEEQGKSIMQHYYSVTLTIVNAKTVLQCVIDLLAKDKIPENNLVFLLAT